MSLVAVGIIYAFLETVLELLVSGTFWIAKRILAGVSVFSEDTNVFETFVNLIPGAQEIHLMAIIKGFSYGLLTLLFMLSILKAIASPITGDDSDTPIKSIFRMIITSFLIPFIFGFDFGSGTSFGGLLSVVGKLGSTILGSLGDISKLSTMSISIGGVLDGLDVTGYLAMVVLLAAIMVTVIGAAITHVQRCVSLGLSIILGPIFVSMNACSETQDTFKQWALSIFTQFLAVFVSMFLWIAFAYQMQSAVSSDLFVDGLGIWNLAIALAILNIMKNSEKILNSFGLRTIEHGDSARALVAAVGAITGAVMMGGNLQRSYNAREDGEKTIEALSGNNFGTQANFNNSGSLSSPSVFKDADGKLSAPQIRGIAHTIHPNQMINNANKQREGVEALKQNIEEQKSAIANDATNNNLIKSSNINSAFAWKEGGRFNAVGDKDGNMIYTSAKAKDGNIVSGAMGDVTCTNGSSTKTYKDAFVVTDGANSRIEPGTPIGIGHDGNQRIIDPKINGPMFDGNHNQIYKTTETESDDNIPDEAGQNIDLIDSGDIEYNTIPAKNVVTADEEFI